MRSTVLVSLYEWDHVVFVFICLTYSINTYTRFIYVTANVRI
jgi:hypothetical protein